MTEGNRLQLIDTNILVYAYDKSDLKKHKLAKEAVKAAWLTQSGVLSIQNLAEFYSIITRKIQKPVSISQAKQIILDLSEGFEILKYSEQTIISAINNQMIYKIPFWDSLIVATMEENGVDTIITENEKDFKKVEWLNVINPFRER
jgi:predicted nucleic acid-binding protein